SSGWPFTRAARLFTCSSSSARACCCSAATVRTASVASARASSTAPSLGSYSPSAYSSLNRSTSCVSSSARSGAFSVARSSSAAALIGSLPPDLASVADLISSSRKFTQGSWCTHVGSSVHPARSQIGAYAAAPRLGHKSPVGRGNLRRILAHHGPPPWQRGGRVYCSGSRVGRVDAPAVHSRYGHG